MNTIWGVIIFFLVIPFHSLQKENLTFFGEDWSVPYPSSILGDVAPSMLDFLKVTSTVVGDE